MLLLLLLVPTPLPPDLHPVSGAAKTAVRGTFISFGASVQFDKEMTVHVPNPFATWMQDRFRSFGCGVGSPGVKDVCLPKCVASTFSLLGNRLAAQLLRS